MTARTLILTGSALVALALPATGTAHILDRSDVSGKTTKAGKTTKVTNVTKVTRHNPKRVIVDRFHRVVPRCYCVTPLAPAVWVAPTVEELQAAYDADLIAHGLDPVYSTTAVTADDA